MDIRNVTFSIVREVRYHVGVDVERVLVHSGAYKGPNKVCHCDSPFVVAAISDRHVAFG
jgi:hypothetical protein